MLVRWELKYIGPVKGWRAEWRARRWAMRSCKRSKRGDVHEMVVRTDEDSLSCYCGELSGQYVESRDKGSVLFARSTWLECESDIEAAEVTRREYEEESARVNAKMGTPGKWEWETYDPEGPCKCKHMKACHGRAIPINGPACACRTMFAACPVYRSAEAEMFRPVAVRRRVWKPFPKPKAQFTDANPDCQCEHPLMAHGSDIDLDGKAWPSACSVLGCYCSKFRDKYVRPSDWTGRTNDGMDVLTAKEPPGNAERAGKDVWPNSDGTFDTYYEVDIAQREEDD